MACPASACSRSCGACTTARAASTAAGARVHHRSAQLTSPTSVDDNMLKGWLQDQAVVEGREDVKYFMQEVYADSRFWGVHAPRNTRAWDPNDYLEHLLEPARVGGDLTWPRARSRADGAPLGNGARSYRTSSGFGETLISPEQMASFISSRSTPSPLRRLEHAGRTGRPVRARMGPVEHRPSDCAAPVGHGDAAAPPRQRGR